MNITQVMSELLMVLNYSTLQKALDIGNLSLENIQHRNPTLKNIKLRLKLVEWWQKSNFQSIFLYFQNMHVFLDHKL